VVQGPNHPLILHTPLSKLVAGVIKYVHLPDDDKAANWSLVTTQWKKIRIITTADEW
jgi:hypothetical protein